MEKNTENFLEVINQKRNKEIQVIEKYNEFTNKYGLTLSNEQIKDIIIKKEKVLQETRKSRNRI